MAPPVCIPARLAPRHSGRGLAKRMSRETDIPHGPMQLDYSLGGFFPQVGIRRRGRAFYQQSSHWHLWLSGLFVVPAIAFSLLPLDGYTKWVWAGFFLVTAACGAAPYFVRNRLGQTIIVDPEKRTLCIKQPTNETTIARSDIVALQLCHQEKPPKGYQLILVWKCAHGIFDRHCLATYEVRRYVLGLARKYESLLSLSLNDETSRSQSGPANGSQPSHSETDGTPSAADSRR